MQSTSTAKPLSTEEQLEKVRAALVSDRINLYLDLKKVLGEKDGTEVYKKLYDEGITRIRKNFPGGKLSILDLMKREMVSFPVLGFELTFDHKVENGEDVYYEHLTKCPFLDMAKKMGIAESPCDFICGYDVELAHRDRRGRWEIISMMGKGDKECQFRIRDWKDEDRIEIAATV